MTIGSLGDLVFSVSAETVRTFDELSRKVSGRWADHEIIGRKPKQQWLGQGIDEMSFLMEFNSDLGVNPRKEIDNLTLMAGSGKAYYFVVGGKAFGVSGMWAISSLDAQFLEVDNRGNVLRASATVTLREYVVK